MEKQKEIRRDQILTVQDLFDFKEQIFTEFRKILKEHGGQPAHQWLKAFEVKKMLRLSESKLQYLRDKGIIPFKKLGGVTYYSLNDIEQLMSSDKFRDQFKLV